MVGPRRNGGVDGLVLGRHSGPGPGVDDEAAAPRKRFAQQVDHPFDSGDDGLLGLHGVGRPELHALLVQGQLRYGVDADVPGFLDPLLQIEEVFYGNDERGHVEEARWRREGLHGRRLSRTHLASARVRRLAFLFVEILRRWQQLFRQRVAPHLDGHDCNDVRAHHGNRRDHFDGLEVAPSGRQTEENVGNVIGVASVRDCRLFLRAECASCIVIIF